MRRALLLGLALVVLAFLAVPTTVESTPRHRFLSALNDVRPCPHRLRPTGPRLLASARKHSRRMARAGHIFHTRHLHLGHWSRVGEVVGVGANWRSLLTALEQSPKHWVILSDCRYDLMAVGFYRHDDVAWLTGRLYAR